MNSLTNGCLVALACLLSCGGRVALGQDCNFNGIADAVDIAPAGQDVENVLGEQTAAGGLGIDLAGGSFETS